MVAVLLDATGSIVLLDVTLVTFWITVSAAVPALICNVTVKVALAPLATLGFEHVMGVVPPTAAVVQAQPAGIVPMD